MTTEGAWTLDTHVLVYATAPDAPQAKQQKARSLLADLLSSNDAALPGQVLSEYLSVVLRKQAADKADTLDAIRTWAQLTRVMGASAHAYAQAWQLVQTHHYQMWDALIVAVCAEHGIKTLYTEDLGSLKRPLGVQVINPFA